MVKRMLLIGAGGLLGGHIMSRASLHPDFEVIPSFRSPIPPGLNGEAVTLDLLDPASTAATLGKLHPDVIVNLACLSVNDCEKDPGRAKELHVTAVERLADAAGEARILHLSTDMVYSGSKGAPYDLRDVPDPVSEYGRSKLTGERALLDRHGNAAVIRSALILGMPFFKEGGFLHWMASQARSGKAFPLFLDQLRTPIAAPDLAEALFALAGHPFTGVLLAGGTRGVNRVEMGEWLLNAMGLPLSLIHPTAMADFKSPVPLQRDLRLDSSALYNTIPFQFSDIKGYIESSGKEWKTP